MNRDDKNVFETLQSPVGVLVNEAQAIQYSFYTADELRRLSVVQVTSSEQRDALNRPLPGGLYDSKMGPTDHYESCATCGECACGTTVRGAVAAISEQRQRRPCWGSG